MRILVENTIIIILINKKILEIVFIHNKTDNKKLVQMNIIEVTQTILKEVITLQIH